MDIQGMKTKGFFIFHGLMSVYGFSRGYRSEFKNKPLFTEKIIRGFYNGIIYGLPIWNIPMLLKIVDRVEIKFLNLNKKDYIYSYEEFIGICKDTI